MSDRETVTVRIRCRWCGRYVNVKLYESDYEKIINGQISPTSLYYLDPAERELFISQTCDDCWNKMFADEEDEEYEDEDEYDEDDDY